MNCPHCFQPVPPNSAFCPNCGARLKEPESLAALETLEDPTYGALAQANLLRLRGDWDAAREKTVAVMREFPNSGTAHSLMGDVFADQQMYEEAAQWYRMALDLEPNNVADARKLTAAEARLKEAEQKESVDVPETPSRFSGFRVAAIAGAVFLIAVIALGFWMRGRNGPLPESEGPIPRQSAGPNGGAGTPPRVSTPNATGTAGTSGTTGATTTPSTQPGTATPGRTSAPLTSAPGTARETTLAQQLAPATTALIPVGLRISDVQEDPRNNAAMITLDGSGVNGRAPDWMDRVYRAALGVAQQSFRADPTLNRVEVRLVMPLATSSGVVRDVAFIGDVVRPAGPATITPGIPQDFTQRWWHAGLNVPAPLASTPPTATPTTSAP